METDVPIVDAFPLDSNTLQIDECPYCRHQHWHTVRPSPYRDIRPPNCQQKQLKKKLRGKPLFYRLQRMRAPDDGPCEVIAFPKPRVAP